MSLRNIGVELADGSTARFGDLAPGAALIVNVASKCGLAPQYAGLQAIHEEFSPQGLVVLGVPCNQFMRQEPGTAAEISEYCSLNYGVTFPILAKTKVNGSGTNDLYRELKKTKDHSGLAGPVLWNFEKFVISADPASGGAPHIARFRSTTDPLSDEIRAAVIAALAS